MNKLLKIKREWFVFLQKITMFKTKVNYFGMTTTVPLIYGMGRDLIVPSEKLMSELLQVFLNFKKGAVLDVGANVGIYLLKLKAIEQDRAYIGIEPNPSSYFYLTELIRENSFHGCHVVPCGLSDKASLVDLFYSVPGSCGASFEKQDHGLSAEVMTETGDSVLQRFKVKEVAVVKIDTEGHELPTLYGLQKTLTNLKPIVYCEVWGLPEKNSSAYQSEFSKKSELLTFLTQHEYQILGVSNDNKPSFKMIESTEQFNTTMRPEYIFVHKQDVTELVTKLKSAF